MQNKNTNQLNSEAIQLVSLFVFKNTNTPTPVILLTQFNTGQCKRTGGCYIELVVAFFSTGGGVKGKKKSIPVDFIYKLAFILFVMTPSAQTTGNIAVYGSAKQLVI